MCENYILIPQVTQWDALEIMKQELNIDYAIPFSHYTILIF